MSDLQTLPLFSDNWRPSMSVEEVAQCLNVSTASVHNWVKTGYLSKAEVNRITEESFLAFRDNIAGHEKLTKRANKSLADSHDHEALQATFIERLSTASSTEYEAIAIEYEAALSNSYKNKEGIYYTPNTIAGTFFEHITTEIENVKFCDPCCGSGNFLIAAISYGIRPENLYGYDVDPVAVEISRRRIFEKTGFLSDNIVCLNFLESAAKNEIPIGKIDVIFTNPPWGKKLSKTEKVFFSNTFKTGKSVDTCSLFFFAACAVVKKGGYVGLLMPESFFNVATHQHARKKALEYTLIALTDFGKPFPTLLTKAKAIIVKLAEPSNATSTVCKTLTTSHNRPQSSFQDNPRAILNFNCPPESADVIAHMMALPHDTLSGHARWGLGIVTGNNSKFIKHKISADHMPVYKGKDILKGYLKSPSNFIPNDISLYQQVPPLELFLAKEKLIYKFISSDLCFYYDKNQSFFINSANMMILNDTLPISSKLLCDLLNSKIMNWFFKNVFETHKILRSDLECLPIHTNFLKNCHAFNEENYLAYLGVIQDKNGTFRLKKQDM